MHFAAQVGGDKEVALVETPGGEFRIQTQAHEYPLDLLAKAQITPEDIKRISSLEDAGVRGGIHSKHTWLVALHDGSLWIAKKTKTEERDEVFTYELAKLMFRSIVPETTVADLPKVGWVSIQRKVAGVPAGRVDGLHGYMHGNDEMLADLAAMLVLDFLIGNPDRHSNNWFLLHNDRLAAIDNGWAGEDLTMSFADVFQPARLAGMMEDERLWPQLLRGINVLIQELAGRGDEVRALAEAIKIDRKEAVEMVRLWEPKLESMAKLIRAEAGKVEKARVYIEPGTQPPLGTQVEEGPRGGHYYESEGIPAGMEEAEPPPVEGFGPQVLTKEALTEAEMFNDGVFGPWVEDYSEGIPAGTEQELRQSLKNDIVKRISEATGIEYDTVNSYVKAWAGSATKSVESLAMQNAAAEVFGVKKNEYIEQQGAYRKPGREMAERHALLSKAIVKTMYANTQSWLKEQGIKSLVLFRGMRWTEWDAPEEVARAGAGADIDFHANPLSSWSSDPTTAEQFANMEAEGGEGEPDYEDPDYLECQEEERREALSNAIIQARKQLPRYDDEGFDEENFEERFNDQYDYGMSDCEAPITPASQVRAIAVAKVPADRIIALSITGLGCLNEQEVVVAGGEQTVRMYSTGDEGGITAHYFMEQEPEPEKPKTAEEQQQAQQKQWFKANISPLFERLQQQQNDLRESYASKIAQVESDEITPEGDALRAKHWELHHEIQADIMAEGRKMIEEAGYLPEAGWATAEEAPMSPALAEWRKEHYSEWIEENLEDDMKAWVDKENALKESHSQATKKVWTDLATTLQDENVDANAANAAANAEITRLLKALSQTEKDIKEGYFRLGAKKIREAGFEPEGFFAAREELDKKEANRKFWKGIKSITEDMHKASDAAGARYDADHWQEVNLKYNEADTDGKRNAIRVAFLEGKAAAGRAAEQPFKAAASKKFREAGREVPDEWKPDIQVEKALRKAKGRTYLKPGQQPPGHGIL